MPLATREPDQAKLDSAQLAQLQALLSSVARRSVRKQSEYVHRSPEAIEFFSQWGILDLFGLIPARR